MGLQRLALLVFLALALVAIQAAVPSELYWNSVLPNTRMPKAIKDILRPGHKGQPVYVGVHPGYSPFDYLYAANEDQLHDDPNVALFFLEKDMIPGAQMNLHFTKSANAATFLPRQIADSIPFLSTKLPEILKQLSVKPESVEAETTKHTIEKCEQPGIRGEDKSCSTSLESMIDFSTSKLGTKVQALSTEVQKETQMQKYTIRPEIKKPGGNNLVACHKQNYAYAVFYCHEKNVEKNLEISNSKFYISNKKFTQTMKNKTR